MKMRVGRAVLGLMVVIALAGVVHLAVRAILAGAAEVGTR